MRDVSRQACAAEESPARRSVRYSASTLLVLIAAVEVGAAGLMVVGQRALPQMLYLLATLALFAASVIVTREPSRMLIVVRVSAVVSASMLFWSNTTSVGPSVKLHGASHDVTPELAGMLLVALLLPRLLKGDESASCNCQ